MTATATIPETVTVPGQVAYGALVALGVGEQLLLRLNNTESDLQGHLLEWQTRLYRAAFFPHATTDDELDATLRAPLLAQVEE